MLSDEPVAQKLNEPAESEMQTMVAEKNGVVANDPFADEGTAAGSVRIELTPCEGGSDSGVEMSAKCCHCGSSNGANGSAGADSESDCYTVGGGSSNGHSPMYYSVDMCDLVSSTRQLSIGDCADGAAEHSPASYDAASENGSESSSLDDASKKGKSGSASKSGAGAYCAKGTRRHVTPPSALARARTPFSQDSLKLNSRVSAKGCSDTEPKSRLPAAEARGARSCSVSRVRTPLSPDEAKWPDGCRSTSRNRGLGGCGVMERVSTYEAYATMPRRKQKEAYGAALEARNAPREPSLNRAASLRKKFLENSLMTTSFNGSLTSPSQPVKTMPPYVKPRPAQSSPTAVKTKIYHETSTQTLLTNSDVDRTLAERPFELFKNPPLEADGEYRIKRRYEEQLTSVNEELKKMKKENCKQRTVIEWLEGELSATKDDKFALQNKLTSIEQRIYSLLRHKGSSEDVFLQLEREVSYNNNVINQLQEEINDLQQMCCILKEDLNKSYSVQKTILESQKASEMESMELQEFLQAEKSTLSDSLRDTEVELKTCMSRLDETARELAEKKDECSNLQSKCDQQREENESTKERLTNLERRCRELLLYQGAAISSASVALSGLSSRFEQLLDQLYTLYSISDADLQNDTFLITNLGDEKVEDSADFQMDASRLKLTRTWLKAVGDIITKTSAEKYDVNTGGSTSAAANEARTDLSNGNGVDERPKVSPENGYDGVNKRNSVLNLITTDDALYSPKPEFDSRRNSMISDLYAGVDNLTLDFGVNDLLNDSPEAFTSRIKDKLSGIPCLRDCNGQDVSLVEQINEIDTLVTKVFKVILLTQTNYFSERKVTPSENMCSNNKSDADSHNAPTQSSIKSKNEENSVQNGSSVPNGKNVNADTFTYLELQNKAINNALSKLHQMQETVDESTYLKKIQTELQTVSEKCTSFLSELNN